MIEVDNVTSEAVRHCLESRLTFALYCMPGSERPVFIADIGDKAETDDAPCFIVSPWFGTPSDTYRIVGRSTASDLLDKMPSASGIDSPCPWSVPTEHDDYVDLCDSLIGRLSERGGKTVLSRVICGENKEADWVAIAVDYFNLHPEAFRYLYYTPQHGAWLGASPEILLDCDKATDTFVTMALAGTRPVIDDGNPWSGKNLAEQGVVRDYIVDTLYDLGLQPHVGKTETLTTGNIQHLLTRITGRCEGVSPMVILNALNPTPALCGWPRAAALEDIIEYERHPRRCYGGYVCVENDGSLAAYVNLRCVNFDNVGRWCMYVGGGIMADSDATDEWDETCHKAALLQGLIEGKTERL